MTPTQWRRVKEALAATLELRPEERPAYLDQVCEDDAAMRASVEALLAADHDAGDFIDPPLLTGDDAADDDLAERGRRIGPYAIERRLGRGGMGSVYLARRIDHEFERLVAIKMIRRGMDSALLVKRFRHERQILASLDHPHIAHLFDGGTTEEGLPYFVMEHVDGVPIDRYADDHRLSIADRLRLFLRVADAVQHAHDRQVVHRDLKPGNVLVTRDGMPKLLDFGIAKILLPDDDGASTLTGLARPMTPDYASPEQVRGEPVTLATDVHALGLLLYELLSGHRPYRLTSHTPDEIARVVCEQDPERPSIAIARTEAATRADGTTAMTTPDTVSLAREGTPEQLRKRLSGAVDDIVLKALRKDPGQRYASAGAMAEDVRRHLDDQPVTAAQGALRYRAGRWLARRRLAVAAALLVVVTGGVTAVVTRGTGRAAAADAPPVLAGPRQSVAVLPFRNLSGAAADDWLSTALAEMFATELAGGGQLRVVPAEVVARAEREATSASPGDAAAAATQVLARLGTDHLVVGSFTIGDGAASRSIRLDLQVRGAGHDPIAIARTGTDAELFAVVADAGRVLRERLGLEETSVDAKRASRAALPQRVTTTRLYARGLERLRALDAIAAQKLLSQAVEEEPDSPLVHAALASAWTALGYDQRASEAAQRAVAASGALNREQRLVVEGQLREAQKDWAAALAVYRTLWGFFSDNAEYGLRLAAAQTGAGSAKDALATVAELRRLPAPQSEDPRVDLVESQAATALGDFPHELAAATQAVARAEKAQSPQLMARARLAQGRSYYSQGQSADAERALEQARALFAAAGDTAGLAGALNSLGTVVDDRGDPARGEVFARQSLAAAESVGDRRGMSSALNNLGIFLKDRGQLTEALALHQRALALRREVGDRNWTAISLNNIGVVLFEQDRLADAATYYQEGLAIAREIGDVRNIARTLHNLAIVQRELGHVADARTSLEQLLPVREQIRDRRGGVMARVELGMVLLAEGEIEAARRMQSEAVALAREVKLVEGEAQALYQLGEIAVAAGDFATARRQHDAALALRQKLDQTRTVLESRVALAALAVEEGRAGDALRLVAPALAPREQTPVRMHAALVAARAHLAAGDLARAAQLAATARTLAAHTERIAARWALEMVDARLELAGGQPAAARARLTALRRVIEPLGLTLADLETELLLGEVALAERAPSARKDLEAVREAAEARGAHLIGRRAGALLQS